MALTEEQIRQLPFDPRKVPDPALALPDLSDAVIGWRSWKVSTTLPRFGLAPKLYSVTNLGRLGAHGEGTYYWTPKRAALAECPHGSCEGDDIPGESCKCGFYSAKNLRHLLGMAYHRYDANTGTICVLGKVACWGKVIECRTGWRSGKAYPVQLYVPFEAAHLAKPLAIAYDAKVSLMNFMGKQFQGDQ